MMKYFFPLLTRHPFASASRSSASPHGLGCLGRTNSSSLFLQYPAIDGVLGCRSVTGPCRDSHVNVGEACGNGDTYATQEVTGDHEKTPIWRFRFTRSGQKSLH